LALRICADRIIIIIEKGADWVRNCKTNYILPRTIPGCGEGAGFNEILKLFGVRDEYAKVR